MKRRNIIETINIIYLFRLNVHAIDNIRVYVYTTYIILYIIFLSINVCVFENNVLIHNYVEL